MGKPANFILLESNSAAVILEDVGPWDVFLTITNDAEGVVQRVFPMINGRRLFYYDTEGELTELIVKDGKFGGFGNVEK